jgi:pectin methylesterase-like acyl-CoA thioesterase
MKNLPILAVITLLATPLAALGQTTVFNDTFGSSTLNPTAATWVAPTATSTVYEIASSKTATGTKISGGALTLSTTATSSGLTEAQAVFTTTPITLSAAGQYIEIYYTFTDTSTVFNGNGANNESLYLGLYYSGGSGPTNGTLLWNGGLTSSTTSPYPDAATGGAQDWLGYSGEIAYSLSSTETSAVAPRPAQTLADNEDQELLYVSSSGSGYANSLGNIATLGGTDGQPTLTAGNVYTIALQLTYVSATSIGVKETLYNGAGLGGTVVSSGSYSATYTGNSSSSSQVTTYTFDSLAVGYRPVTSPSTATTLPISNISVISYTPAAPGISGLTNQTVIAGSNATVAATVSGGPAPALQWWVSTDGGVTSNSITGATSASLSLPDVQYSQNNYEYSLVASNSLGVAVSSMTLNVIVTPSITGLVNEAGTSGSTIIISPTVSGVPTPTYQWETNGVDLTDGLDANGSTITGSTTSTLTIANAQAADSMTYSLIASNSAGLATNSMILTVSSGNVAPVISGLAGQTVIQGNNATFTASVSGLPVPALQWLDETGAAIPDATNATLTLEDVQYSQNGFVYSLVATNEAGSVTNTAALTVLVPPSITTQPVSVVVTNTASASFTVAAAGVPNPTYQWYSNNIPVSGATLAAFSLASVSPSGSGSSYYVQVSNSAGVTNSGTVTLTVNSTMTAAPLSPANGATGVCYDTPLYLAFSVTPTLQNSGKIRIYNVTNSATPVDTIDLSQSVTPDGSAKDVQPRLIASETFTNYPVIITGSQAAIYPHLDVLTSNQTYYVTVDDGTFADAAGANFAGITATNAWQFTTKAGGPANPTNILVAADGSGDFVTVQGGVDSVPANNTTPTLININNGTYTEIVDIRAKNNLLLRGQSRAGTLVGYPNNANLQPSTHFRMAFKVNANDISLDNLTVTNMTPVGGSQAEALMLESNVKRFIFNNCNLGSYQDTLLANGSVGAQGYFNNSLIEGQFDYIWGGGDLFFTNCEARTLLGSGGAVSGGNLTAARTDNQAVGNWPGYLGLSSSNGFSFVGCRFTRSTNTIVNTTLADSNGTTNGNVAWIYCSFDANYILPATGVLNSQLLWEYGNSNLTDTAAITFGLAVGDSAPALSPSDPRLLAAENADTWLNGWAPQLSPNILTNPVGQTVNYGSNVVFTVAATGVPNPTYQWFLNGTNLPNANSATLTIPSAALTDAGNYFVVVTTPAGSVTSSVAALVVNPPPNTPPVFTAPFAGTNIVINVGVNLAISCTATDTDVPAPTLTYSLLTGPAGAAVDPNSGLLTWRPTVSQSGSSNPVQVAVTDNGSPALNATNSFTVTVNPLTAPVASAPAYAGGLFSITVSGQAGPDYELQATTNLVSGIWVDVVVTNSPLSPFTLTDTNAAAQPVQFYRIVTGPPLP